MKTVLLRLLVVITLVVGIGWLALKLVDFPGHFSSIKNLNNKQYEQVSLVIIAETQNISDISSLDLSEFNSKKDSYIQITQQLNDGLNNNKTKKISMQNEKSLKSDMKKVYKTENDFKDYTDSLISYANSTSPDHQTLQNMVNNCSNRLISLVEDYQELEKEISSYYVVEKTE